MSFCIGTARSHAGDGTKSFLLTFPTVSAIAPVPRVRGANSGVPKLKMNNQTARLCLLTEKDVVLKGERRRQDQRTNSPVYLYYDVKLPVGAPCQPHLKRPKARWGGFADGTDTPAIAASDAVAGPSCALLLLVRWLARRLQWSRAWAAFGDITESLPLVSVMDDPDRSEGPKFGCVVRETDGGLWRSYSTRLGARHSITPV